MSNWLHFITDHPYLWGIAFVIIVLLLILELEMVWRRIARFSAAEVSLWMNREAVVLDINENADFLQGHILGSLHVPFSQWSQKITDLNLDKSALTIIVASQERQAVKAAVLLQQQGFKQLGILAGGLGAWKNANLPLAKR